MIKLADEVQTGEVQQTCLFVAGRHNKVFFVWAAKNCSRRLTCINVAKINLF